MFTLTYSSLTSVTACVYILLEIVFLNKNILKLFKKTQGKMSQLSIALHAFCIIVLSWRTRGRETVWQQLLLKKQTITEDEDAPLLSNTAKR